MNTLTPTDAVPDGRALAQGTSAAEGLLGRPDEQGRHRRHLVCRAPAGVPVDWRPERRREDALLECVTGLRADRRTATFEGAEITEPPATMALVFQDYGQSRFPWMTSPPISACRCGAKGIAREERAVRVQDALEALALPDVRRRYPWQLPGCIQELVALAYQPDCLVMDESFASVDAQTRFELEDLIRRLQAELGITVLFVTHDIDEAVYLSDRVWSSPDRRRRCGRWSTSSWTFRATR